MNAGRGAALLADIGGTNARFAVCQPGERPGGVVLRAVRDFPDLEDAIADVLATIDGDVTEAVLAVAGPVDAGVADLSNSPWRADADALCRRFGWHNCRLINDFAANALSLPLLRVDETEALGGGGAVAADRPKVVLGPGTGLGVAGLVPTDGRWVAVPGEGGHASLAPEDEYETALVSVLRRSLGHVSHESVLCGPGLLNLYHAVVEVAGPQSTAWTRQSAHKPADVTRLAREEPGGPAGQTIAVFSRLLGAYAGDLALIYGAHGGVYLTGGVIPALGTLFDRQGFRQRFTAKGRFSGYLEAIATLRVTAPQPALIGLSSLLD